MDIDKKKGGMLMSSISGYGNGSYPNYDSNKPNQRTSAGSTGSNTSALVIGLTGLGVGVGGALTSAAGAALVSTGVGSPEGSALLAIGSAAIASSVGLISGAEALEESGKTLDEILSDVWKDMQESFKNLRDKLFK